MNRLYIGMDVHKKYTMAVALDEHGKVLNKHRIEHGSDVAGAPWKEYFSRFSKRPHVAVEATGVSYAVLDVIEPFCASVVLSNPLKTRLIAEQRVKTDKIDAKVLAQLLRTEFLPTVYIPPMEVRGQRELLRQRISLVHLQTGVKNRIHGILTRCGMSYTGTDLYGKAGREYLTEVRLAPTYREEVDRYLRILDNIAGEIKGLTREIHQKVTVCQEAMLLTTIFGIGKYLAALIYWEIGDIGRFRKPAKLVGYCGLGSRVHATGGKCFYGPITKQGNKFLRWGLVEAAQKYGTRPGPLGDFFQRVKYKHGGKAARVALARKLATIIWHMLTKKEAFDEARLLSVRRIDLDEAATLAPSR